MDGDSGNKFLPAARQSANNLASGASFRAEQIITSKDVAAAYHRDFITALALVSEDEAFEIRSRIKGQFPREFNTKEFDRRLKQERANLTPAPEYQSWQGDLIRSEQGAPRSCIANAITAFRRHESWRDVLAFDEFSLYTVKRKPTPWDNAKNFKPCPWTDNDDREAANWLQHNGIMVNTGIAGEAAETVAYDAAFHPVREYLLSLKWDGEPRIERWLSTYIGTADTGYERAIGHKWLISAVARVMDPGCKVDHCLVFEGGQGAKKSTALSTMGDPWFIDHLPDLTTKDACVSLCGVWIIEMGELASFRKTSSIETIKEFLVRKKDRFRPPFGRRVAEIQRQQVFSASTNKDSWSGDETGGRRFWPIKCGEIQIDELKRDRDQLWAEALFMYSEGRNWWLDDKKISALAEGHQDDRYEGDAWDDLIMRWCELAIPREERRDINGKLLELEFPRFLSSSERVTIEDVLIHAVGKPVGNWSQWDKIRVAKALRAKKWTRMQIREGRDRGWYYEAPLA